MKIYLRDKSVTLVGKSWEVRRKLAEYAQVYVTVQDWLENKPNPDPSHFQSYSSKMKKKYTVEGSSWKKFN